MTNYVDNNGNFTHTKIIGNEETVPEFLEWAKKRINERDCTDSQKILLYKQIEMFINEGIIPNGLLLELVMPSVPEGFRFDKLKPGGTVTFDLPPRFKDI